MSFLADLRTVSSSALEQLADRFSDLPRPLLAAIGAGDMAVERLAELREALMEAAPGASPDLSDVRSLTADLPARAQKVAFEVAGSLEHFASQAPVKAQELMTELPGKVSEIASSMSQEMVRETVEAYTQLAGLIYGNLANRGEKTWSKVRSSGLTPGTVVDAKPERTTPESAPESAPDSAPDSTPASAPEPAAQPVTTDAGEAVAPGTAEPKPARKASPRAATKRPSSATTTAKSATSPATAPAAPPSRADLTWNEAD